MVDLVRKFFFMGLKLIPPGRSHSNDVMPSLDVVSPRKSPRISLRPGALIIKKSMCDQKKRYQV